MADEQVDWTDSDADGEVLWILANNLGSVTDAVDNAGTLRLHRDLDSYGNVQSETHYNASGSTVTSGQTGYVQITFGYTAKLFEIWTGLQYNNARWYDAKVGRWISKDPISFAGGTDNLSEYVGNAPVMYVDPSGLQGIGNRPGADDSIGGPNGPTPRPRPRPSPKFQPPTNPPQMPPAVIPEGWRVRPMPPTEQYPNGYWRLEKPMPQGGWQGIDPSTGKPGTQAQTHIEYPQGKCPVESPPQPPPAPPWRPSWPKWLDPGLWFWPYPWYRPIRRGPATWEDLA
jgi:RHS repeat-associated protein